MAAGILAATAVVLPGPAAADHFGITDVCIGVDHPPFAFDPPGGGNSYLLGRGRTDPPTPGAVLEIVIGGSQPPAPFEIETDDGGNWEFPSAAIQSYGSYPVLLTNADHEVGSASIDVGPEDVACPALPPAAPADDGDSGAGSVGLGQLAAILAGVDVETVEDPIDILFGGLGLFNDPTGDHIYSDPRQTPGAPSGTTDITQAQMSSFVLRALEFVLHAPLDCGSHDHGDVVCPEEGGDPASAPPERAYLVTLLDLVQEVPSPSTTAGATDLHEYAVVYESNGDPTDDWMPQGPFAWDGFQGTDRWYVMRGEPGTDTWVLDVTDASTQMTVPSDARGVLVDDAAVFLVPTDELVAPTGWRGYAFNHDGTYQPGASAMDVTGGDPTEPLLAMPSLEPEVPAEDATPDGSASPAPSVATSETPTEVATPVDTIAIADPTDADSRSPLWPLVAIGGLTALGGTALTRRRGVGLDGGLVVPGGLDDAGGGLALVKGPCDDELVALDRAQSDCAAARAAAAAARERLAAAEAAEAEARAELAAARAELPGAGDRDRSSWVESEGRRLDSGDIAAGNEADAAVWDDYRAGRISGDEAMQRWGRRGSPEEVERLRDADALARGLETQLAAAESATAAARSALAQAEAAADAACSAADAAAARLERCRDRVRAEAEAAAAAAAAAAADAVGTGTTVTAPPPPAPVTTAGGDDPRDEEQEKDTGCCSSGIWILYGRVTASFGFIVGRELVNYTARCVTSPGKTIEFEILTLRIGLGAGLSGGGLAGVIWGAEHPREVYETVLKNAGGPGLDIDLGVPWAKAGKAAYQLRKSKKLLEKLKELADSAPTPKIPPSVGEGLKDAALDALPSLGGQAAKQSIADLVVVPGGLGIGVAVHWGKVEESQIISMVECADCPRGGIGR